MGVVASKDNLNKSSEDIKNILNKLFVDFIKTSSFDDFTKFHLDPKIREQITIITNEAIEKNLKLKDIEYVSSQINEDTLVSSTNRERVIVLRKSDVDKLDVSDSKHKKELSFGIAKYYIKIYSIFSAIMVTVNPEFNKNDDEKSSSPLFSKPKPNLSLCSRRIHALTNGKDNLDNDPDGNITIQPQRNICEFSLQDKLKAKTEAGYIKKLSDEIGIKELEQLYFNVFDPKSGTYNEMNSEAKKKYQKDLAQLYKTYTGKSEPPSEFIDSFTKINLKDYHNSTNCSAQDSEHKYPEKLYGNIHTDDLFKKYASLVNNMIGSTNAGLNQLLGIIDIIFKVTIDNTTGEKDIVINSNITMPILNKISDDVINILLNLYTKCENHFQEGIDIINSIVAIDKYNKHFSTDKKTTDAAEKLLTAKMEDINPQFDVLPDDNISPDNIENNQDKNNEDPNKDNKDENDDDDDDDDEENDDDDYDKSIDNVPKNPDNMLPNEDSNLSKDVRQMNNNKNNEMLTTGGGFETFFIPIGELL